MPRNLKPGDEVNGYVVEEELNRGNTALAYRATAPGGDKVFLKAFKSPTPMKPWYRSFISYQEAMKKRIEDNNLSTFLCRSLDFFEAPMSPGSDTSFYFQVFEFVERGNDLEGFLDRLAADPTALKWERRLVWAKVIMGSINQMHRHKIVHGDLKPANLMMIADDSIKAGHRLKLIDIDFAVMSDVDIPWAGDMGFIGTPGYFSPEHVTGKMPEPASDVFTCGIILSELLTRTHPFHDKQDDAYVDAVLSHRGTHGALDGAIPGGSSDHVLAMLRRMLNPDPGKRPAAAEVLEVLNGAGTVDPPPPPPPPPPTTGKVVLRFDDYELPIGIATRVNQRLVRPAGADMQYWDPDTQFTLERRGGEWYVVPNTSARNETVLNGAAVTEPTKLARGDVLGAGRAAKGVIKLPATVELE